MNEYKPWCTLIDIAMDEINSHEMANYDDMAHATQHQESDDLEEQSAVILLPIWTLTGPIMEKI